MPLQIILRLHYTAKIRPFVHRPPPRIGLRYMGRHRPVGLTPRFSGGARRPLHAVGRRRLENVFQY